MTPRRVQKSTAQSPQKDPAVEERRYGDLKYRRQVKDRAGAAHGDLFLPASTAEGPLQRVASFPHISRVYRLQPGARRVFGDQPFFVEEKLDGYNVRIFSHNGRLLAATRGGFICPFTTEWLSIWDETGTLTRFFQDHPRHVLCGEVCGDNPFNNQRDPNLGPGAHIFFFDIMAPDGNFLAPETRYHTVEQYGLPSPPRFGRFTLENFTRLKTVLLDLNERYREGVVMKPASGTFAVKYVTPNRDLEDIKDALIIQFDLHQGFFRNRLLRARLFVQDFRLDWNLYERKFGEAFMQGLEGLKNFGGAEKPFTIYLKNQETWAPVKKMLTGQVQIETDRVYRKSTHRFYSVVQGFPHKD